VTRVQETIVLDKMVLTSVYSRSVETLRSNSASRMLVALALEVPHGCGVGKTLLEVARIPQNADSSLRH